MKKRRILVTSALPYANGPIHLGHMLEYIQTDIWARFQKSCGHECYYVCASDAHGTPIMLKARELDIDPEILVAQMSEAHQADFKDFHVAFDAFHTTHSKENEDLVLGIYQSLKDAELITKKDVKQFYDPKEQVFLPDRYVRGQCPKCHSEDQYGDSCEVCGSTYDPKELVNARSVISGETPVEKSSEHVFFKLDDKREILKQWLAETNMHSSAKAKLQEWFGDKLQDWDISRNAPYFGFKIPDTDDQYFYVWLDAPVGYMASFQTLCEKLGLSFSDFWKDESKTELYHFVGKDILYFHGLFWPAMLSGSGFRLPSGLFAHGFLTVDGQKMSKRRGTFLNARQFLDQLDPETLRYYYAAKLSDGTEDIDLNLEDFVARVNSDLVGKLVNIASRCSRFIEKNFDHKLSKILEPSPLYDQFVSAADDIASHYESRQYARGMRAIMGLADLANQHIDQVKPWQLIKDEDQQDAVQQVCTLGLNLFRTLVIYLSPVLPQLAEKTQNLFGESPYQWKDASQAKIASSITSYEHMFGRIQDKQIKKLMAGPEQSKASKTLTKKVNDDASKNDSDAIDIDVFKAVDLRIAKVLNADTVEGADKLVRLTLDIGEAQRQVFAGIKAHYSPEDLVGRLVIYVANLKPRKMRFGVSEGMVLAASKGDDLYLLSTDSHAKAGMKVS